MQGTEQKRRAGTMGSLERAMAKLQIEPTEGMDLDSGQEEVKQGVA